MERQAKDGTFYRKVGPDEWEPVTRKAKDGTVFVKVGKDDWSPLESHEPRGADAGDNARAALEGFAEIHSLGTLPYLKAAGEVATDWLAEKTLGVPMGNEPFEARVQKFQEQGKDLQEKAPGFALAGKVAGFFVPGVGVSRLVGKGLQVAAQAPGRIGQAAQAMSQAGRARDLYRAANEARLAGDAAKAAQLTRAARLDLAAQGGRLGLEGAALGAAYTPESGFTDLGARLEGAATGFATGMAMPATLRTAGNVARGTGKVAAAGGRKLLSAIGGVSDDVIKRYLEDPNRIRNASTFDELYEQVTGVVNRLVDDLDNKKVDYDAAKAHLDDVAKGIKESRIDGKARALEEVQQAKAMLDEAFKQRKAALTDQASPTRIDPLVSDALNNQKSRVTQGSKESFEILGQQNKSASIDNVVDAVDEIVDDLYIGSGANKVLKNDSAEVGVKLLEKWRTKLHALADKKGNIPFKTLKEVLQGIDSDMRKHGNRMSSDFNEAAEQAMFSLRKSIDNRLKFIEPYKAKMAEVADDTRILSTANKRFGSDTERLSRLSNIARPAAKYDLDALKSLAAREGGELPQAIESMVDAQRTLRSPTRMDSVRGALPENQAVRAAEMKAAVAKRMAKPREVQKAIERSGAFYKARSAKANLETAKGLVNKFKSFGEQGAEAKLRQVAQGRKHATKTLEELSKLSDQDFVEAVRAASDAAAFTKTAFHGSRNVNFWSVMGALGQSVAGRGGAGAAGGLVFGGPVGMALGAVTGAMMDVYGPTVTKKILDGVIKIKGPITTTAIRRLDVPDNVKRDLVRQFQLTVLSGRAAQKAGESRLPRVAERHELDEDSSTPSMYRKEENR